MVKAVWNGAVIAESDSTVKVEGNHYFPAASVRAEYLEDSLHRTVCAWKGEASYYSVVVDGQRNPDAAWYHAEPKALAAHIKDQPFGTAFGSRARKPVLRTGSDRVIRDDEPQHRRGQR